MRTNIPEKVLKIVAEAETKASVPLTRLKVLEKWFEQRPERLERFGLWIARKTVGRKGKTKGEPGALLDEARQVLGITSTREGFLQRVDLAVAKDLYERARVARPSPSSQAGEPARVAGNRLLRLVEKGLALYTGLCQQPGDGYQLAADWAQNNQSRDGAELSGSSTGKLNELVRFMFTQEALEEDG